MITVRTRGSSAINEMLRLKQIYNSHAVASCAIKRYGGYDRLFHVTRGFSAIKRWPRTLERPFRPLPSSTPLPTKRLAMEPQHPPKRLAMEPQHPPKRLAMEPQHPPKALAMEQVII